MATDGWYPPALENFAPTDGSDHLEPVTIGVLHTTESTRFIPNRSNYFGHQSYPHFTVEVVIIGGKRVFQSWQHISIRKSARALKNMRGGVQTNLGGLVQIEVVGSATRPFTNDPVMVEGLRQLMRWLEVNTNIPRSSGVEWRSYPGSYGQKASQRLSFSQWQGYEGWCGHQHVPENDHGDPGAINIATLLSLDNAPTLIETKETPEMLLCKDPNSNDQYTLSGNTRRKVQTWNDYQAYIKAGIPVVVLSWIELSTYPEVGVSA